MTWADDPVDLQVLVEEHRDHARARARGERLRALADAIVSTLEAHGLVYDGDAAIVVVYGVLADHLYGNHAVDIPTLRRGV